MGVGPPRLLLNAFGSIAVLMVVAVIGIGLPALDRAVAGDRPLPAGQPYRLGAGVSLMPPAGATLDAGRTRPGRDHATAVFHTGDVRLAVQAARFDGRLPTAVNRLRTKLVLGAGCRVTGSEQPVHTAAGAPGIHGEYVLGHHAGQYAAYLAGGVAVEATVEGPPPELSARLPAVQDSLASLTIESQR